MTVWSTEQQGAINKSISWYKSGIENKMLVIAGYAGTGKTTIAKEIAAQIADLCGGGEFYPQFVTFTGKAASVLRAKGCEGCTTIHSLLYSSSTKSKQRLEDLRKQYASLKIKVENGTIPADQFNREDEKLSVRIEAEKKNVNQPSFFVDENSSLRDEKLVIVDEYSMLDQRLVEDLLKVCQGKVLFLGDPGQLPPVGKKAYKFTPDIFLEQVHRQALDSPILRAATFVRENGYIDLQDHGDFKVVRQEAMCYDQYKEANQIITGKNDNAKMFNRRFRQKLGFESWLPYKGEKVMCFKNNHDLFVLNGVMYDVTADCVEDGDWPETAILSFTDGLGLDYDNLPVWSKRFQYKKVNPEPEMWSGLDQFDYCYGITAHKSQGSEWDNVIVYDDYMFWNKPDDRKRWLYTSITRAAKKCTVVRS